MRENGREKYARMSQKCHDRVLESPEIAVLVMLTNARFTLLFYDLNASPFRTLNTKRHRV
ncbi:hypothetical protein ALC57_06039 [Trachymyrmex cornetzi]|uniref:Uncharacterized protein n=1 Tax=Trachymyrmex cornetzi TaxID=471704 RepID=A0A151J9A5_9HYME|nr:hypothetical protein ALC57_06039 [Trachymyrmex cornetzi]